MKAAKISSQKSNVELRFSFTTVLPQIKFRVHCWALLGSIGHYWALLGSIGQYWAVLGSIGQY